MRTVQVVTKSGGKHTVSTIQVRERNRKHIATPISGPSLKMDLDIKVDKNMLTEDFFALCRKLLNEINS